MNFSLEKLQNKTERNRIIVLQRSKENQKRILSQMEKEWQHKVDLLTRKIKTEYQVVTKDSLHKNKIKSKKRMKRKLNLPKTLTLKYQTLSNLLPIKIVLKAKIINKIVLWK